MLRLRFLLRNEVQLLALSGAEARIGSAPDNDVVLDDRAVSGRHAAAWADPAGGGAWIEDRGSKNGLLHRGRRVPRVLLRPGDTVRVGHATIQLESVPEDEATLAIELPYPAASPREDRTGTSELTPDFDSEPQRVIQLVREMSAAGHDGWRRHERELLPRARALIHAETLALGISGLDGQLAFRLLLGPPVSEPDASRIAALLARAAEPGRGREEGRLLVVPAASGRGFLAAVFARPGAATGWRIGLLEEVASWALSETDPEAERDSLAPVLLRAFSAELRLPPYYVLGSSPAARRLAEDIQLAVLHPGAVLVLGEPGAGKEGVARAIHDSGPRAGKPFLAVNVSTLRSELAAAELFGIEEGVATAVRKRPGLIAEAAEGTIFLDEIGELRPEIQADLLRVLQGGDFLSVGGRRPQFSRARFIAATNRDLDELVRRERFRPDLLARLSATVVRVPPLRERVEDLPEIATVLLSKLCARHSRPVRGLSVGALRDLEALPWRDNVRELEHELEHALLSVPAGAILERRNFACLRAPRESPAHAAPGLATALHEPPTVPATAPATASGGTPGGSLGELLDAQRRAQLLEALRATAGHKAAAARRLGISRSTLYLWLERFGVES